MIVMLAPYGSMKDPNRGKPLNQERCAECNIAFAIAEEFTVTLTNGKVHPHCLIRKLEKIGTR